MIAQGQIGQLELAQGGQGRLAAGRRAVGRFVRAKPLGAAGALVLLVMVLMALGANIIAPYDPLATNPAIRLQAPSVQHLFGTDYLGRDLFSRIVYGARPSLYTGLTVVSIVSLVGLIIGVSSAFLRGWFDLLVQRLMDALLSFPQLLFAMALLAIFSSGVHVNLGLLRINIPLVWNPAYLLHPEMPVLVVVVLVVLFLPGSSRTIRGATFGVMYNSYVEAAQSIGCSRWRIITRHLIPNVIPTLIVIASVQLGAVILIEASLSFLGLGLPPPNPSWGAMLQGSGRQYMEVAPWLALFPGAAISLSVLGFNLFGDALRDVLDPRMRGTGASPRH
jgi:peptide/nickel transport system permease protein